MIPDTAQIPIPATTEKSDDGPKKYTAFVIVIVAEVRRLKAGQTDSAPLPPKVRTDTQTGQVYQPKPHHIHNPQEIQLPL